MSVMNFKYLLLGLLNISLIAYVSSIPDHSLWGDGSLNKRIISNLAHIPAYALLTFLWLRAFDRKKYGSHFPIANTLILIGLVLFAVSDEFHQSFVPGRTASLMDVGLDLVGIFLGLSVSQLSLGLGQK